MFCHTQTGSYTGRWSVAEPHVSGIKPPMRPTIGGDLQGLVFTEASMMNSYSIIYSE